MTNKKSLAAALISLAIGLSAINVSAETKEFKFNQSISKIEAEAGMNVTYNPTSEAQTNVKVSGDADQIEFIEVKTSGSTLKIRPVNEAFGQRKPKHIRNVSITVAAPAVSSLEASSGARINCTSTLSLPGKKIELETSSGAKISTSDIVCKQLDAEADSGSKITASSITAEQIGLESSSGANISISNLKTNDLDCDASSGSSIKISSGKAANAKFEASSSGSIKASGLKTGHSSVEKSSGGSVKM